MDRQLYFGDLSDFMEFLTIQVSVSTNIRHENRNFRDEAKQVYQSLS